MLHHNDQMAADINKELVADHLAGVHADVDDTDTCYLNGTADSAFDQALAVEIAVAHGANIVVEGIDVPGQEVTHLHRRHFVESAQSNECNATTPEGQILGGADLSDRVFDSPHMALHTGTPLVTHG